VRNGSLDRNNQIYQRMQVKQLLLELIDLDIMKDHKLLHKLEKISKELCKNMQLCSELKKHSKKELRKLRKFIQERMMLELRIKDWYGIVI
jgi:hypothetical protein